MRLFGPTQEKKTIQQSILTSHFNKSSFFNFLHSKQFLIYHRNILLASIKIIRIFLEVIYNFGCGILNRHLLGWQEFYVNVHSESEKSVLRWPISSVG